MTPRNVGRMLLGLYEGTYTFENQIASLAFRYRLPTEALLPLTAYGEWAADDEAGALRDVPAIAFGLWVPALPALPEASLGVERTRFAGSCCGNPEWYRHPISFRGNWAVGDAPLGHPLGGHGSQWLVYAGADLVDARLRLKAELFRRTRDRENLFAPERVGESWGAELQLGWRFLPRAELNATLFHESGDGWRAQEIRAGTAVLF